MLWNNIAETPWFSSFFWTISNEKNLLRQQNLTCRQCIFVSSKQKQSYLELFVSIHKISNMKVSAKSQNFLIWNFEIYEKEKWIDGHLVKIR